MLADKDVNPLLGNLLNRGGMNSMMSTLLICFCALSFAGTLALSGALEVIVHNLLKLVHSTGTMILATIACGLTMISVTCNGQISILIPIEMLRSAYIERGLHPKSGKDSRRLCHHIRADSALDCGGSLHGRYAWCCNIKLSSVGDSLLEWHFLCDVMGFHWFWHCSLIQRKAATAHDGSSK